MASNRDGNKSESSVFEFIATNNCCALLVVRTGPIRCDGRRWIAEKATRRFDATTGEASIETRSIDSVAAAAAAAVDDDDDDLFDTAM